MKRFKELTEELFTEGGGDMMPADEMTLSELKIACFAANNILERLENGAMIQRWQISAIVKAKEELASVYTSISADEMDMDDMDAYDDMEDEEEPMYVGFEYPSMYGEAVELDEETKYVVKGKSPFYKQDHYINTHETPKAQLIKKNIKQATHMDLETAKKVAKEWESHPNKYKTEVVPVNEEVELDEGILKSYHAMTNKPWSETLKSTKNKIQIAKGKDFIVWTGYTGSSKQQPHYVVKDDKIIGSGMTINSALKDAGLKDSDLTFRSKFNAGSFLNKGFKEETDYEVDVEGLPKMYVKGDNPSQVKNNLRKVVKNPDMIRGVERVAKATLQKMFRDKASGRDEVEEEVDESLKDRLLPAMQKKKEDIKSQKDIENKKQMMSNLKSWRNQRNSKVEEVELDEGYNDPIHREYISDVVHNFVPKDNPKHEAIVDHLHKAKNFGTKTKDDLETKAGISLGAAHAITKAVASDLKANFGTPNKTQTQSQRVGAYLKQKQVGPRSK